jgi:hypothetical protein
MRKMILSFIILVACFVAWAYPVYKIGDNFQGIDKSTETLSSQKYEFQGIVDNSALDRGGTQIVYPPNYKVFIANDEYQSVRLESPDGKTLWKTSKLIIEYPNEFFHDNQGDVSEGEDYKFDDVPAIQEGVFLRDPKTMQRVYKKFNGEEIRLPEFLTYYYFYGTFGNSEKYLLFMKLDDSEDEMHNTPLSIVEIDMNGRMLWRYDSEYMLKSISGIYTDYSGDSLFIESCSPERGFITIISNRKNNLCKQLPKEIRRDIYSADNSKTLGYMVLFEPNSRYYICDLNNGEIVAKMICSSIDITLVGEKLIGIIGYGSNIAVIDIKTGHLIQDLSDYSSANKDINITRVKISPDAKDIWFCDNYQEDWYGDKKPEDKIKTKHYKMKE